MTVSKATKTKQKQKQIDPLKVTQSDPNKHSAFSLAEKLKERKRLNQKTLAELD